MAWNHEDFKRELTDATQRFDWERTHALCADLVSHLGSAGEPYPAAQATGILSTLQRKQQFAVMQWVADVLIQSGQRAPTIQRQYAQALIEQGQIFAALQTLTALRRELEQALSGAGTAVSSEVSVTELGETRGLLGRAHKQAYVNAPHPGAQIREHLLCAIEHYYDWYRHHSERTLWHGINTVALLCRAQRDRAAVAGYPDPQVIARDVAAVIRRKKDPDSWDCATAMEAYLATGEAPEAQGWLAEYIRRLGTDADAFEYGSTLRQLEEVWQLDAASEMGARLLEPLRNALLRQAGGAVKYQSTEIGGRYEGNFGAERFRDLDWLDKARQRCRNVARLGTFAGVGMGTGFVIRGSDLHERFGPQLLLLTNSHVVADRDEATGWGGSEKPALFCDEVRITFESLGAKAESWTVKRVHESQPPWKLDFSLLELDHPPPVQDGIPMRDRPVRGAPNERVYIIGHPYGESLKYSLYDNLVLGVASPLLHYRTPTEKGSSGSPVFDDAWELIGIHHKGGATMRRIDGQAGTYAANEGILVSAIRAALA